MYYEPAYAIVEMLMLPVGFYLCNIPRRGRKYFCRYRSTASSWWCSWLLTVPSNTRCLRSQNQFSTA
ncbi:hypothetical protein BDZ89DRAFT_1077932 [Hymenopellis radicata]|nr:hypothetical protein BDZ89DRAFT_1077932 [Hymenopellis radicata]